MSPNSPSTTPYAYRIIDSIKPIFRLFPPQYRVAFKKYSEYILKHRVAIHYATEQLPILVALVVIQVERDLDYAHEINELHKRIAALELRIDQLVHPE